MVMYRPPSDRTAAGLKDRNKAGGSEEEEEPPSYESLYSQSPPRYVSLPPPEEVGGVPPLPPPGIVTIKFLSESPSFNEWLESSLVRFLAPDCLSGPRQRRAF